MHASLPFTVLKLSENFLAVFAQTGKVVHASLPFTVLKLNFHECRDACISCGTVVHASLPFTVLKRREIRIGSFVANIQSRACFPTVYGFETLRVRYHICVSTRVPVVHASLPFTVLKLLEMLVCRQIVFGLLSCMLPYRLRCLKGKKKSPFVMSGVFSLKSSQLAGRAFLC